MRNRLFKLAVAVSITLAVLFTGVWIAGYFHRISLSRQSSTHTVSLSVNRGRTELVWSSWQPIPPSEKIDPNPRFFGTIDWPTIGILGVYVPRIKDSAHFRGANAILIFPAWIPAIIAMLPPLCWMRLKRKQKTQPNHCRVCDYDLRATPDRCPECGTSAITQASVRAVRIHSSRRDAKTQRMLAHSFLLQILGVSAPLHEPSGCSDR